MCALIALASAAFAGTSTYSTTNSKQQVEQAPCPTWYADNEFNVSVWGTYAPTTNNYRSDRYLGVDHAFGGGIDANYFFRRYFGLGVSGFGLALDNNNFDRRLVTRVDDNNFAGGVVGKLILRYPIPCSRFAPYGFVGGGGIWGGGDNRFVSASLRSFRDDNGGRLMAQYGAGFEVRFTPHIGMLNDVVFNQVDGGNNDFLMVRSGLNFAF
ncbi:MAG: outer membrane beta-barrel protein [Chthoniobacterales bacterium]